MNAEQNEKMLDLLTQKAAYGLTAGEQRELDALDIDNAYRSDISFELAAAAISLIDIDTRDGMSTALRLRVLGAADEYFGETRESDLQPTFTFEPREARTSAWTWLGWLVAGAACIALAVNIFTTRQRTGPEIVLGPTPAASSEKRDARKDFDLMLASADVVRAAFGPPPKAPVGLAEVAGDVVWSDAKQAGYMKLKGLPQNDPANSTYQLWIFDETQDAKTPIDGGTFDVTADGEVVIPIDAKLTARNPKAFAITIEKPGGVVVSDRKRIAAFGAVAKSET